MKCFVKIRLATQILLFYLKYDEHKNQLKHSTPLNRIINILQKLIFTLRYNASMNKQMSNLHYFKNTYEGARDFFLKSSQEVCADLNSHALSATGTHGEALTIDVASIGSRNPKKTILVTTGLHGIEGFTGSAILTSCLNKIKSSPVNLDSTAIVLVHALNPYGFSWKRRTNENNVDLNRNFILETQEFIGASSDLKKIPWLQHPVSPNNVFFNIELKTLETIFRYGFKTLRNALLLGQFEYPRGLFFGGKKYEESCLILQKNIDTWTRHAPKILHIDFHTGIGKNGTCHLLTFAPVNAKQTTWLRTQFGQEVTALGNGLLSGGKPDGIMVDWVAHHFESQKKDYAHLVAEFGTYPATRTFKSLYQENRFHNHPGNKRDATKKDLMEVFNPSDPAWRNHCVTEGVKLISQAIETDKNW